MDRNEPASIVFVLCPPECSVLVLLKRLLPSFRLTGILRVYKSTFGPIICDSFSVVHAVSRVSSRIEKKAIGVSCKHLLVGVAEMGRNEGWKWAGLKKRRATLQRARESRVQLC